MSAPLTTDAALTDSGLARILVFAAAFCRNRSMPIELMKLLHVDVPLMASELRATWRTIQSLTDAKRDLLARVDVLSEQVEARTAQIDRMRRVIEGEAQPEGQPMVAT